jgi:hypothetical protein
MKGKDMLLFRKFVLGLVLLSGVSAVLAQTCRPGEAVRCQSDGRGGTVCRCSIF